MAAEPPGAPPGRNLAPRLLTHQVGDPSKGHRRIATVPFTLRNLKEDLEDVGSRFDGAPDLEFRLATEALELERSGLGYQRVRGIERQPEAALRCRSSLTPYRSWPAR
jgi:hypothetical protein